MITDSKPLPSTETVKGDGDQAQCRGHSGKIIFHVITSRSTAVRQEGPVSALRSLGKEPVNEGAWGDSELLSAEESELPAGVAVTLSNLMNTDTKEINQMQTINTNQGSCTFRPLQMY